VNLAQRVRAEFPLLSRQYDGRPLVFLDSASTTPKPRAVIDAVVDYYENRTANVHRGVHLLGEEATDAYEAARIEVASLVNGRPPEIVFVRGTTEAINLVAHGLRLEEEDEIVFAASEHHANFLPWRVHGRPRIVPIDAEGIPLWDDVVSLFGPKTRLLAVGHVSNVTGAIAPIDFLVTEAKKRGVPVLLDAAQSLSHLPLDVGALGVDFLAASAHKAFGPSGVGFLWGKSDRLAELALYQVGGGMVAMNEDDAMIPRDVPFRFEAGTPAIEGAIGFGAAVKWLRAIGLEQVRAHDRGMMEQLLAGLDAIPQVRVLGRSLPAKDRIALATFVVDAPAMTQENVARALSDTFGVCVSGGFHCAHVLHARAKLEGTVRASPHVFNDHGDLERLFEGLREITA
jgi:cysteine desulfurase/selenocysteine lyase